MDLNTLSVALLHDRAGTPIGNLRDDLVSWADPGRPRPIGRIASKKPCGNCLTCKCSTKPVPPLKPASECLTWPPIFPFGAPQ